MSKAQKQSVGVQPSSTAAAPTLPGASASGTRPAPPDPEVSSDRPKRRTFDAAYKKRILEQHDAAREHPGEIGALLRREGLYSSLVSEWKRQRDDGAAAAQRLPSTPLSSLHPTPRLPRPLRFADPLGVLGAAVASPQVATRFRHFALHIC
jgi:transposase-like protein